LKKCTKKYLVEHLVDYFSKIAVNRKEGQSMENPERRIAKRMAVTIICAMLVSSALLFIQTPKVSATPDEWTEETYDDFIDSTYLHNIVIKGKGAGAWIELATIPGWHDMASVDSAGRRYGFGFVFDSKNNVAVLFGGYSVESPAGVRNDTWEYDYSTNTWTEIIPDGTPGSPSRREMIQMDYDSVNEVIVLWGGVDVMGVKLEDTWEYDVNTQIWSETSPTPSPPPISGYALAYESVNNKILMTGTNEAPPGGVLHLWAYDAALNTWTERTSTPYPRGGHDMAFKGDVMVLQGGGWGMMGEIQYDDTLVYNYGSDSWTRYDYDIDPTLRPGYRIGNAMARFFNGVWDVSGYNGFLYREDSWNFIRNDYNGWVDMTPSGSDPKPSGRKEHRMVWDSYHNCLILYGGSSGSGVLNDTWVMCPTSYTSYGWYVSEWNSQPYFDSGMTDAQWLNIYWYEIAPPGTKLKFQLQASNVSDPSMPDPDRTPFCGPDGTTSTYYETPGEAIWAGLSNRRYIRYEAILEGTLTDTPEFHNITITFTHTGPVAPYILSTDPVDDEECVPLWKNITVIFSETMNTSSLTWTIIPDPDPFGWSIVWSSTYKSDDTVILKHASPFAEATKYNISIAAEDLYGNPLDPSMGVPNPWSFSTGICAPHNLKVIRSPPDIIIRWDAVPGADEYRVYESKNRFAWPWSLLGTVIPPATQFVHVNAHEDSATHYYIVRAVNGGFETGNSTMGVKTHLGFEIAVNINTTDINWLSLPYNSIYKKASDIASELTHNKVRVIGKWDSAKQKARIYSYYSSMWKGDNFDIIPGDGIFIAGLQQNFSWIVTGTDLNIAIDFKYSPKHRWTYYWLSIPYTGIYTNASSIVIDIEGNLFNSTKMIELGKWNPATQSSIKYYWDGSQWTGKDFIIEPGDGIYFRIKSDFNWPIKLVTPAVL